MERYRGIVSVGNAFMHSLERMNIKMQNAENPCHPERNEVEPKDLRTEIAAICNEMRGFFVGCTSSE